MEQTGNAAERTGAARICSLPLFSAPSPKRREEQTVLGERQEIVALTLRVRKPPHAEREGYEGEVISCRSPYGKMSSLLVEAWFLAITVKRSVKTPRL